MKIVRHPAAAPQSMSRQRSPTIQLRARSISISRAARRQHPGCGLAKFRRLALARIVAHLHAIDRQLRAHCGVHGLDLFAPLCAAAHIRLIRRHDQQPARRFQSRARFLDAWQQGKLRQRSGRVRLPLPHHGSIDHPIAIEEDSAFLVCGHFLNSNVKMLNSLHAFPFRLRDLEPRVARRRGARRRPGTLPSGA